MSGKVESPQKPLRISIAWRLFLSVTMCIVLLLGVNWLLNNFALVNYYQQVKEASLRRAFDRVETLLKNGTNAAVTGENGETVMVNTVDTELYRLYSSENIKTLIWLGPTVLYNYQVGSLPSDYALLGWTMPNGSYSLQVSQDSRLKTSDIVLVGKFSNGASVMMRTPVAAIEESVGITNRFLLLSGSVTLVIGLVLVLLVSRSFTRPIRALSRVAGSVARLDFSDRYHGKGRDEIQELGDSINAMSEALEGAVAGLRQANLQLQQDNELKTRESEARKAFIANVSHELKTPIALIQTYAEGLREGVAGDEESRALYCGVIEDEAQKMSEMIRRMTSLMQLEAGGGELDTKCFDIAALCRALLNRYEPRFADKRVCVTGPEREAMVEADPSLIENVLTNYLNNALNHVTESGSIRVAVEPVPPGRVRVTVFNSGECLPEEELPRIWESFYKVDKARTRAYGGSGIGLSVVAAVMRAHGMPCGVRNCPSPRQEEAGVEFFIELSTAEDDPKRQLP
ncbi:MAG: HAMP domain-containing histidine kinase [Clostridiales bacterium]|nr:HAMP domain-containing histidine kinase [Clostridiales bacterium]